MDGQRVGVRLGEGEWIVYCYRSDPASLYTAGPYTATEADAVALLFRSKPYRDGGFRHVERVSIGGER